MPRPRKSHSKTFHCPLCGTPMLGSCAKFTCPTCHYREDCSDALLVMQPEPPTEKTENPAPAPKPPQVIPPTPAPVLEAEYHAERTRHPHIDRVTYGARPGDDDRD